MKKRISAILLALVLCLTLLPAAAYADGGTAVYVSSNGNDWTGDGSADKPTPRWPRRSQRQRTAQRSMS